MNDRPPRFSELVLPVLIVVAAYALADLWTGGEITNDLTAGLAGLVFAWALSKLLAHNGRGKGRSGRA